MPNRVRVLTVPDADRAELERRARSKGAPARVVERARIVLLAAAGLTGSQIAERAGCTEPTVVKWRRRYAECGLAGLEDAPRPGGPRRVLTDEVVCEILAATVTPPTLRAADLHPAHRPVAEFGGQPPDQLRSEQPDLGRPGRGVGGYRELAVGEAVRPGVRGQVRADDLRPAAEH